VAVLLPAYLLGLVIRRSKSACSARQHSPALRQPRSPSALEGPPCAPRTLQLGVALLMAATGLGFASFSAFAPLLVVAFIGTLNPGSGDVSVCAARHVRCLRRHRRSPLASCTAGCRC
jgi:hypothetical protein